MYDKKRCPMCGSEYKVADKDGCSNKMADNGHELRCAHYNFTCIVHASVEEQYEDIDKNEVYRRFNALVSFLLKRPQYDGEYGYSWQWRFFYDENTKGEPIKIPTSSDDYVSYNIANEMVNYPRNFQQQVDKSLIALSMYYQTLGYQIPICGNDRALYYVTNVNPIENAEEIRGMLDRLTELEYLRAHSGHNYEIAANGWIRIGELSSADNEINQGFIAMEFSEKTTEIGIAFSDAIKECGYMPRRIDHKEHNNQIVPEIFFEIRRSKFLVVDVTHTNPGAYYEAGYGEALNKQVIVCCEKNKLNTAHFDIAQKNAVVWETIEELKERLIRRIEATVGMANRQSLI